SPLITILFPYTTLFRSSSFDTTRAAIQNASESFAPYVVAKHYADEWLRATDLKYTIIHPGLLTNDEPTGKVTAATTYGANDSDRSEEHTSELQSRFDLV